MTAPVFYAPTVTVGGQELPLAEASEPGQIMLLGGEEGRHAAKAQRLRVGEVLDLVDGLGFRTQGFVIDATSQPGLMVEVQGSLQEAPTRPQIILVQGLAKGGRDEQAIETSTEVGVDAVIPWQADRSVVRWDPKKRGGAAQRWSRVLVAAMKQSRRAWLPKLEAPLTSTALTELVGRVHSAGDLVLVCHESATEPIAGVLVQNDVSSRAAVYVIVGPEGGITDQELDGFVGAGAIPVLLGPHVLRSSTAGPAAIVAVNIESGRW